MKRLGYIAALLTMLGASAPSAGLAGDAINTSPWMVAETVEVVGHSPRNALRLYEQGSIDALGFRPTGGDIYCFSVEIWMADGRQSVARDRTFHDGEVGEFVFDGTDRRVDRIEYSCHPRFGVTSLSMDILVR